MSESRYTAPRKLWGDAVTYRRIDEDGKMWIGNGEYETQVNYCPFTGIPADKQMGLVERKVTRSDGTIKVIKEYINEGESDL